MGSPTRNANADITMITMRNANADIIMTTTRNVNAGITIIITIITIMAMMRMRFSPAGVFRQPMSMMNPSCSRL